MKTVYRIYNIRTNRSFIGVTSKTQQDGLKEWMKNCGRERYKDYSIAEDFRKYGKESFKVDLLGTFEIPAEAKEFADNQMDNFGTLVPNGYNSSYIGIRKMNPDYYEKREIDESETIPFSVTKDLTIGEKTSIEREMADKYGIDNLVRPSKNENYATPEVIAGLRELADDLEKYGNVNAVTVVPKKLDEELQLNGTNLEKILKRRKLLPKRETTVHIPENHTLCFKCGQIRPIDTQFYSHFDRSATTDGIIHLCKICIAKQCKETYEKCQNFIFTLITMCQLMNIIFVQEMADKSKKQWEQNKDTPETIVQYYMSNMRFDWLRRMNTPRVLLEFRNSHFVGDIFGFEEYHPSIPKVFIPELNGEMVKEKLKKDKTIAEELEQKWGKGFKQAEYIQLEEEYQKLEKFLSKKTELHIEALKKYVIYSFKEKMALAQR